MPLLLTIGARLSDSLPLFESVSSGGVGEGGSGSGGGGGEGVRTQAMAVLRRVDAASPARMAIDAGPHALAYLVEDGVVLLALAERAYPRKLVFAYLAECHRALAADMAAELGPAGARAAIDTASKPYAFMKFERTLHRIAREFADPSSKSNTAKLVDELQDIQHIMRKNIQEVLDRGEKLEQVSRISSKLVSDSKQFKLGAKKLNDMDRWRQALPCIAIALLLLALLWWRFG